MKKAAVVSKPASTPAVVATGKGKKSVDDMMDMIFGDADTTKPVKKAAAAAVKPATAAAPAPAGAAASAAAAVTKVKIIRKKSLAPAGLTVRVTPVANT